MVATNAGDDIVASVIGGTLCLIFVCGFIGWICGWSDPAAPNQGGTSLDEKLRAAKARILADLEDKANSLALLDGLKVRATRKPSLAEKEAAQLAAQERSGAIQQKMAAARVAEAEQRMLALEAGMFEEAAAPPPPAAPRDDDARYAPAGTSESSNADVAAASAADGAAASSAARSGGFEPSASVVSDARKSPERDLSAALSRAGAGKAAGAAKPRGATPQAAAAASRPSSRPGSSQRSRPPSRPSSKNKARPSGGDIAL